MPRERDGKRKRRSQFPKRNPDLGYYFIVTDTAETEKNYLEGLRDSLPQELRGRIVIKVDTAKTENMLAVFEQSSFDPQYRQNWIVFDRDKVVPFDEIIREAESRDIRVGWSNPCIEIWFSAYFGKMPAVHDSVSCCQKFKEAYERATGREYKKADRGIYATLNRIGNEIGAIKIAETRLQNHLGAGKEKPSDMCPATTLHRLVAEIRNKTKS